jgi:hypothetical protein
MLLRKRMRSPYIRQLKSSDLLRFFEAEILDVIRKRSVGCCFRMSSYPPTKISIFSSLKMEWKEGWEYRFDQ